MGGAWLDRPQQTGMGTSRMASWTCLGRACICLLGGGARHKWEGWYTCKPWWAT